MHVKLVFAIDSNIIRLLDVLESSDGNDLYLVFDFYGIDDRYVCCLMRFAFRVETDLHEMIKANLLQSVHKRFISWQVRNQLYDIACV